MLTRKIKEKRVDASAAAYALKNKEKRITALMVERAETINEIEEILAAVERITKDKRFRQPANFDDRANNLDTL